MLLHVVCLYVIFFQSLAQFLLMLAQDKLSLPPVFFNCFLMTLNCIAEGCLFYGIRILDNSLVLFWANVATVKNGCQSSNGGSIASGQTAICHWILRRCLGWVLCIGSSHFLNTSASQAVSQATGRLGTVFFCFTGLFALHIGLVVRFELLVQPFFVTFKFLSRNKGEVILLFIFGL